MSQVKLLQNTFDSDRAQRHCIMSSLIHVRHDLEVRSVKDKHSIVQKTLQKRIFAHLLRKLSQLVDLIKATHSDATDLHLIEKRKNLLCPYKLCEEYNIADDILKTVENIALYRLKEFNDDPIREIKQWKLFEAYREKITNNSKQ